MMSKLGVHFEDGTKTLFFKYTFNVRWLFPFLSGKIYVVIFYLFIYLADSKFMSNSLVYVD